MRCARGLLALVLLTAAARAEHASHPAAPDPRTVLAEQIAAELDTLGKTITTVDAKLADAETVRLQRVRAAFRILRTPAAQSGLDDRMASARRRAAARLLLDRDRAERALLADEVTTLKTAETTLQTASNRVPAIVLPTSLTAPVQGTLARHFGTIVHDRSGATLARRGLDYDVAAGAQAVAPADGVVVYAGPMRGLDHGVILDHGDYLTVIAKLAELAIPVGAKVTQGDRLGRSARQRVYFELRAKVGPGGVPIDPEPLLAH